VKRGPDFDNGQVDRRHTSTPMFFGGFYFNYIPTTSFNLNLNAYWFTRYTFLHSVNDGDVDGKFVLNAKFSYRPRTQLEVFFNARDLLNTGAKEFVFSDDVKATYLLGLTIRL
jgi:hypothetical protein